MYSNNDFERLFIRYKAEGLPRNESIQHFCDRHGIPYNLFDKWYRDTRHKLVPVQVSGRPEDTEAEKGTEPGATREEASKPEEESKNERVRIMVSIKMTNGIHISQRNLDHKGLRTLVERLEGLC